MVQFIREHRKESSDSVMMMKVISITRIEYIKTNMYEDVQQFI